MGGCRSSSISRDGVKRLMPPNFRSGDAQPLLDLHIEFEGLFFGTPGASHRQNVADLVGKPDSYRKTVVEVAGIVVDLGEAHDVPKHIFQIRNLLAASQNRDKYRIGSLWPDICIELLHIARRPEIGILLVENDGGATQDRIIAISKQLGFVWSAAAQATEA